MHSSPFLLQLSFELLKVISMNLFCFLPSFESLQCRSFGRRHSNEVFR